MLEEGSGDKKKEEEEALDVDKLIGEAKKSDLIGGVNF